MQVYMLVLILVVALLQVVVLAIALAAQRRATLAAAQCLMHASQASSAIASNKKLSVDVAELGELCERMQESLNKWRGRAAANAKREADDHDLKKLQGAAWKDQMRKQLKIGTPAIGGTSSEG